MKKLTLIVLMLIMMLTLHAEDINNQKIYQPGGGGAGYIKRLRIIYINRALPTVNHGPMVSL